MVGNDIIDIGETKRSTDWERPGFLQKIFTQKEQEIIYASADPFTTVWQLWSMKESAYKIVIQTGAERSFNPSRFECDLESLENGLVRMHDRTFKTTTKIDSNYVFTTASFGNSEFENRVFKIIEKGSEYQSAFMQEKVLKAFLKHNALKRSELKIQKTKTGVPKLFYKNKVLNRSFSIAHHGKYGAYSIGLL